MTKEFQRSQNSDAPKNRRNSTKAGQGRPKARSGNDYKKRNKGVDWAHDEGNEHRKKGQQRRRGHSQRGGRDRAFKNERTYRPTRKGYREERDFIRANEPELPADLDTSDLDSMVVQDLRVLSKDNADAVAKHMLMAIDLLNEDPKRALEHARAAKNRAGRVGVAREVNGIVAYRAGEWKEALSELRAARRISGGPGLLAVMADCERGLGRPEKTIELGRSPEVRDLDSDSQIELAIVVAGARRDLGQTETALTTLERLSPSLKDQSTSNIRVCYAYADTLLEAGQKEEALRYFQFVASADFDGITDADDRVSELS